MENPYTPDDITRAMRSLEAIGHKLDDSSPIAPQLVSKSPDILSSLKETKQELDVLNERARAGGQEQRIDNRIRELSTIMRNVYSLLTKFEPAIIGTSDKLNLDTIRLINYARKNIPKLDWNIPGDVMGGASSAVKAMEAEYKEKERIREGMYRTGNPLFGYKMPDLSRAIEAERVRQQAEAEEKARLENLTHIPSVIGDISIDGRLLKKLGNRLDKGYKDYVAGMRMDTRMARIATRHGGIDDETREMLEGYREELLQRIPEFQDEFRQARASGDRERAQKISQQTGGINNLIQEITHVLDYGQDKQERSFNKYLSAISNVISALGVASLANRVLLQEPYQFGTRPMLGMLGNQGEIGALLAGAHGEVEAHRLGLNQMAAMGGAGAAAAGLGMAFSGGLGRGLAGGALALGGSIAAYSGFSGQFGDFWMNLPFTVGEDEILGKNMVQTLANPQNLINHFMTSRAGLMAAGGGLGNNFGYNLGGGINPSSTGNFILDQMGMLTGLGYTSEQIGGLLSSAALSLQGSGNQLTGYATAAGKVASAFGISEEAVIANMMTAQRYGSSNALASLYSNIGAAADGDGNISSYTTNVLVPALMKVTESLAIRNLARSGDAIEKEVHGLRRAIVNSDTNLGTLAETNPEVFAGIVSTLQEAVTSAFSDPAKMAFGMSMGNSFSDILFGRPQVIDRNLRRFLEMPMNQGVDFSDTENIFRGGGIERLYSASSFAYMEPTPQNLQTIQQLLAIMQGNNNSLFGPDGKLIGGTDDLVNASTEVERRVNEIMKGEFGELASSMAEQTNAALQASITLIEDMQILQTAIKEFVSSDTITTLAKNGIEQMVNDFYKLMGREKDSPYYRNKNAPPGAYGSQLDEIRAAELDAARANFVPSTSRAANPYNPGAGMPGENAPPGAMPVEPFGHATGGFTGMGGTHDIAGIVHANEYVISQNNVNRNRQVLDRIQAGEKIETSSNGKTSQITIRVSGVSEEEIYRTAQKATEDYIVRRRLNYT